MSESGSDSSDCFEQSEEDFLKATRRIRAQFVPDCGCCRIDCPTCRRKNKIEEKRKRQSLQAVDLDRWIKKENSAEASAEPNEGMFVFSNKIVLHFSLMCFISYVSTCLSRQANLYLH